jgi:hypothetical protein
MTLRRVYCTYFDSAYLARGIVMLRSLRRHDPSARILTLALDEQSARAIRDTFGGDVQVIETETLHAAFPELRAIREQRTRRAYYSTQKPALALFAMGGQPRPAAVIYIDADTWFFSDPSIMLDEIGAASVGISPHRFPESFESQTIYGLYNAGCICWRNDETGRRCLADWHDDCVRWCEEAFEADGRYMNQGYLNAWPERYNRVHILQHPGSNLGPWNVDGHMLAVDGGRVTVNCARLVFYHFSRMERDTEGRWFSYHPFGRQNDLICESIYWPYIEAVEAEGRKLKQSYGIEGIGTAPSMSKWPAAFQFKPFAQRSL